MPASAPAADSAEEKFDEPQLHPRYVKSEELGRKITELKAWLNAGEYKLLMMIREFDREGLWKLNGIHSCAHWLNWKCSIGMNAAREKVRVANALGELPKVSEEYASGKLSYSKARAITRIATPENEDYLLNIARYGTASHVESLVAKYRRCKRLQDTKNAARQHREREFSYFYDDDGCLNFRGRFPAEQGALVLKALELAMERAGEEVAAELENQSVLPKETLPRDDGLPQYPYYNSVAEETRPTASFSARRADALGQLAESYLAHGPESTTTADRYQVVLHVTADTMKAPPPDEDEDASNPPAETSRDTDSTNPPAETSPDTQPANPPAETSQETHSTNPPAETSDLFSANFSYLEQGPHVAAETARRVACDSSTIKVTVDDDGEPLSIGRRSRTIPPAMRRALKMRDDGCQFPGCTHKHMTDGHHLKHWADGGETSMENILTLCRHHHRLVHEGGFDCQRNADGKIVFINPIGNEIGFPGELPPVPPDTDPMQWLQTELDDLEIDSDTGVTQWRGERIDWALAVGHLFDKYQAIDRPTV